jgi:outer membrane protein assembly factor BamB/tetratricopeptide (TPR) repeat protein
MNKSSACLAALLVILSSLPAIAAEPAPAVKEPYKETYAKYKPTFIQQIADGNGWGRQFRGWTRPEKVMRLSSEPSFFTLNMIEEDARANALVKAALAKEENKRPREALKMYQQVINQFPNAMYRVSKYGVYVPVSQYCQRRILRFPAGDLGHYRTMYDAAAKEKFANARRKHSLIGLSEVVDSMFATSYGGRAVLELGNADLDAGHYLAALERFNTIRDFFPDPNLRTTELDLKIAICHKMLGQKVEALAPKKLSDLAPAQLRQLRSVVKAVKYEKAPFHSQLTSAPYLSADDYTLFEPTTDPLAIREPTWKDRLPGSRRDFYVYTQPVVTGNSVIYRHKNIIYSRSILTGELRWVNDLGGRAAWQNWDERQYPQEDLLVQDGLVFAVISKGGPSLVALDETTGQLKWAYGPMVASTQAEARMRLEAAPAGGPLTVYIGYVLDNIEGDTHTDTEYGLIAFESATGRLRWRRSLCRLAPGKFSAGFAVKRRNRIRSFTSPPLYHQGTVYYTTNAGSIAALESLSGRVKWLMRYPYHPGVHDATRRFGGGGGIVKHGIVRFRPHSPMFWYNQRPLIVGERLYVLPVDTPFVMCMDRRSGKVLWSKPKGTIGAAYLQGPIATGELVLSYTGRNKKLGARVTPPPVQLIDPKTGKTVWGSKDLVLDDEQPVMKYRAKVSRYVTFGMNANQWWYETAARPLLTRDGKLYVCSYNYAGYPLFGYTSNLAVVSLPERKIIDRRHYYGGELRAAASRNIHSVCPPNIKALEELPHKNERTKWLIKIGKEVAADTTPENKYGPFLPFSRLTFRLYDRPFELRIGAREVSMLYDVASVRKSLEGQTGPKAEFARAELALADSQLDEASTRLKRCLTIVSSEDLDFRALIKQQLFRVHKRLARSAIRATRKDLELENALGMSRTAGTLAEEIETLFALADAYERQGQLDGAARCLRSIISTYGHHEYPISPVAARDAQRVLTAAREVMDKADGFVQNAFYGDAFRRSITLLRGGLPLYLSTVSPLPKPLTVRAGELAAARLIRIQQNSKEFAGTFEVLAARELSRRKAEEQLYRLWEFPGAKTSQKILEALFAGAEKLEDVAGRTQMWKLADAARASGLDVPKSYRARVLAPPALPGRPSVALPVKTRQASVADAAGINWLVLERSGQRTRYPDHLFLGGRVRKRLDNKFVLACFDLKTGKPLWKKPNIRLRGTGQEPGFFKSYVHNDLLVVHGLYDVLAYDLKSKTQELKWRYRVPFNFEIKHSLLTGDLLMLSGKSETLALYVPTASKAGEVVWQVAERGDTYIPTYMVGDRVISVRKLPFNVTARFRATGKLIGRLELPDLSMFTAHPLLENGPEALPAARDGKQLVVTDGWYYVMVDVEKLAIVWKRLIDSNDATRQPAMRFAVKGGYLSVVKEDYDQKTIYMLSSTTGKVLWRTDVKNARSPQPMHSMFMDPSTSSGQAKLFGIGVYPGQGFYFVARDCKTGKLLFQETITGYDSKPVVSLIPNAYGTHFAVKVQDRQLFELNIFERAKGKRVHVLKDKGNGPFGIHGRVSVTVQNGRPVMLSKDKLGL